MWFSLTSLVLLSVSIGIFADPLFKIAEEAAYQLLNPEIYINAVFGGNP